MYIDVNGIKTFYRQEGEGKDLLLLHGWGGSNDSFAPVFNSLKKHFRVTAVDFWGFGKSGLPPDGVDIFWYADMLDEFLKKLEIAKIFVISHSFGCRVFLILASKNKNMFEKAVICDGAGIKPKFSIAKKLKVLKYKFFKKLAFLKIIKKERLNKFGSDDFKNLPPEMKKTFVKVVNCHLDEFAKSTNAETLLVWGKKDKDTPLYMAKKLNRYIKNSGLVIFEEAGHFCYLDDFYRFDLIAKKFFGVI